MKYFIDTEFLEGKQYKTFLGFKYNKTKPTIDLISIGIVAEDGREYYAISKDFNLKEAWNRYDEKPFISTHKEDESKTLIQRIYWIRENVLKPIWNELSSFHIDNINHRHFGQPITDTRYLKFNYKNFEWLINKYGKTNKQIAEEIKEFVYEGYVKKINLEDASGISNKGLQVQLNPSNEFYGYYVDYDWVAFCWLFGNMIDLPNGFPFYCIDLKQTLDEKVDYLLNRENQSRNFHNRPNLSFDEGLEQFKTRKDYPKQTNEHNALADAKWNKELYNFLNNLI